MNCTPKETKSVMGFYEEEGFGNPSPPNLKYMIGVGRDLWGVIHQIRST